MIQGQSRSSPMRQSEDNEARLDVSRRSKEEWKQLPLQGEEEGQGEEGQYVSNDIMLMAHDRDTSHRRQKQKQ